jgi:hypothetical protein
MGSSIGRCEPMLSTESYASVASKFLSLRDVSGRHLQ